MSSRGESPPAIFFAADAAPRPGGTAPASIRTSPHPVPDRKHPAPSDRVRMRPPPPHRSGPALSGPGPGALAAVGVGWWLAAGRPACGRPASGLVAGRLGAGGRSPPAGALCRGGGGPVAGCGRLGVGLAALPAPVPRLRLIRPPPAGPPQRPGGGVGAAPCLGPARGSLWAGPGRRSGGQRPPGPAPFPTPGRGGTMPPGRRGFGVLPPAGGAPLRAAARRPPMRGGWGLDSAACGRRGTSTGRKGVCGKPGKGVLHDDDPHFSELFEVLKNVTASRKDFFDSLTQQGPAFSAGPCWVIKEGSLPAVPEEVEGKESGFTPEWPGRRRTRRRWHGRTSPAAPAR